jgi:Glycosyltransferase family 87
MRRSRAVFMIIVLLGQAFLYGLRWWTADILSSDFPYIYTVTRLYQAGKNPYDLASQCRFQSSLRPGDCAGYSHTPFLLPLLALLFNDNYFSSYWRWAVVQILLLSICLWLLFSISNNFFPAAQSVLFPPIILGLWFGNDTSFILTALLGSVWLLENDREVLAGLSLSLMAIKPQLAIPLAIPISFVRPRVFKGFFLGGLLLTSLSLALVGFEGFRGIIAITRSLSVGQTFGGVTPAIMFNTTGILARLGLPVFWAWPVFLLAIVVMIAFLKKNGVSPSTLSVLVVVSLFTSPYLFFYDLAYLALPLVCAHPLAPALASLITGMNLLPGFPTSPTYFMMAVLLLWLLRKLKAQV